MPPTLNHRLPLIALVLCCTTAVSGCASWQGPRIDPTGQRFIVWPGQQPVVAPAPYVGPPIVAPPPGAVVAAPSPAPTSTFQSMPTVVPSTPFGNVIAPPVYSDPPGMVTTGPFVGPANPVPVIPAVAVQGGPPIGPPIAALPALPPPPPIGPPIVAPPTPMPRCGCDFVRISPNGLIAPVGSEMILKAGIASQGELLANRRIEWSIARNGVGQFTELGFRDSGKLLGMWAAPQMIDSWTATSNTAVVQTTLNASNPNPGANVPVFRGEAWVTATSAVEGTSIITASSPDVSEFNQAHSTIYWIDAQWVLPQPTIAEPGRSRTLTTTLMRRTDGAPLAGWIVRYDVAGGAALGYEGGSSVETTTDAAGRASVEVSPKDVGGGVTNVGISIVRPQTVGPASMPRLELGRWATTITWNAGGPPVPLPAAPVSPSVPFTPVPLPAAPTNPAPAPSLPPSTTQPPPAPAPAATVPPADPYAAPPAAAAATGTPRLEITLRNAGPDQVAVGDYAAFELVVTNRGNAVARHIVITDRFDRGLRHPSAQPNEYTVTNATMGALPPNESATVRPTFQVVDGGQQCHEVTVTADGAAAVSQRACVTARQAALEVTIDLPRRGTVGASEKFSAVVKNTGDVPATNIELAVHCDPAIVLTAAERGHEPLPDGFLLKIDRLIPNERRTVIMQGMYRSPSNKACARALVTADGGVSVADEECVEILPPQDAAGSAGGAAATAPAVNDLRLTVAVNKNPARVGEKQLIEITVTNAGQQTEHQIYTRVFLPQEMTVDASQIQPQNESQAFGQEIRFAVIADLPPGQQKQYIIPVTPSRTGQDVQVRAQVAANGLATTTVDSERIGIISGSF